MQSSNRIRDGPYRIVKHQQPFEEGQRCDVVRQFAKPIAGKICGGGEKEETKDLVNMCKQNMK